MPVQKTEHLTQIARYYSEKLALHGDTPQGVDWNGEKGQYLRFNQLTKMIEKDHDFSINDLGCGYGAFYDYLLVHYREFLYHGIDLSDDMIQAAKKRYSDASNTHFLVSHQPKSVADYTVASGIFNVRTTETDAEWQVYIEDTLDLLDHYSRKGFAFNCLTSYSDSEQMKDYLYYSNPCFLFDLCKQRYSNNVALLHDYGLYEFTILVRKTS